MAHHQFVLASGRRIGVSVLGEPLATRLVVLCLPTLAAGPFDPDPTVTDRAPVRLIQIDRPGYGASDPLPANEPATVERFADDIAEYLRSVEDQASNLSHLEFGPVGVVGWSFGGVIGAALAARHPDLVDRLVIVATPRPRRLQRGEPFSLIAELRKHGVERGFDSLRASLQDDGEPTLLHLGVDEADPALSVLGVRGRLERMLDAGWMQGASGAATDRLAVREHDWLTAADRAAANTLLVYGADDIVATMKDANWFQRHLEKSTLVAVPNAGHLVFLSEWARILDFVAVGAKATP